MPIYQIETSQGTYEIDADREPTQAEALAAIGGTTPASIPSTKNVPSGKFAQPSLTPPQIAAINVTNPLVGLIASQLRGRPVTAIEAMAEGGLEEAGRLPGQIAELGLTGLSQMAPGVNVINALGEAAGVIPKDSLENLIKRAVSPLNRAPQAISEALGVYQGPERAKFREPIAAAVGEVGLGLLNPVTEEAKAGQTIAKLPGEIRTAVEKLSKRGITRAPLEDAVTRATGITAQEGSLELAPIVKTRILQFGGTPETAQKAVAAADKAANGVLTVALDGLGKAETQGLAFVGDAAIDAGRQQILFNFPSMREAPEEIDKILSSFAYLKGNIKPTEGQGFLRELNSKYLGLENKNSPEASAYRAIRSSLSSQLDEVYKAATGINDSPYRDWGHLQDFIDGVGNQIIGSQRAQGGKAEKGITAPQITSGRIKQFVANLGLRSLVPREIEAVDAGIGRIFSNEVSKIPKPEKLSADELTALREKYLAKPPVQVPPLPAVPTQASGASLEQQIAAIIKTYPAKLRKDPAMARAAAIGQLQGAQAVPKP